MALFQKPAHDCNVRYRAHSSASRVPQSCCPLEAASAPATWQLHVHHGCLRSPWRNGQFVAESKLVEDAPGVVSRWMTHPSPSARLSAEHHANRSARHSLTWMRQAPSLRTCGTTDAPSCGAQLCLRRLVFPSLCGRSLGPLSCTPL